MFRVIRSALGLLSLLVLVSCGSRAPAPAEGGELRESYAESAVLRACNGDLVRWEPKPLTAWEGLPASVAPVPVAAVAWDERSVVIAMNRVGLFRLRIDPGARTYGLERLGTGEEFSGRSVGGLFRRGDRVFCLLYRDPVFERDPVRDPPSILLSMDLTEPDSDRNLNPYDLDIEDSGESLFAVFPLPEGKWAVQLRSEKENGVESEYRSYDPETDTASAISRSSFERDLTPRLLSTAPETLRRAAILLAPEGCPVVVSASLADGSRAAYTFGDGAPENAVELRGAVTEAKTALIAWNAVAAVADDGEESAFRLPPLVSGAVYRDIVPLEGAILALWEVGVFPNIEESGAVLLPTP